LIPAHDTKTGMGDNLHAISARKQRLS